MTKALKILLYSLAGIVAACAVAVVVVLSLVNADSYKPTLEAVASEALGMKLSIGGSLHYKLGRHLELALDKVTIRNRDTDLATIQQAELQIALWPLFRGELHYGDITLRQAHIDIQRDSDGHYNYEKPAATRRVSGALNLPRVSFADLVVSYTNQQTGDGFELQKCNGGLTQLHHPGDAPFLQRLSLTGELACAELRSKATASDVKLTLQVKDGVFDFKRVTLQLFGGLGSAEVRMDRSGEVPTFIGNYALKDFRIEDFFAVLSPNKSISGRMNFSADLNMSGRTRAELRASASGNASLSGSDLVYNGTDLDREFAKYESSQNFNLFDLGAVLFAGPLGLAVTKGYDFSSLALQRGGSTQIHTVASTWQLENGVAHAVDVAMATKQNRLAMQGDLDFVTDQYDGVVVALLDTNGCTRLRQAVHGSFSKPVVEKPGVLKSIAGPVTGLLDKAKDLLPGTGKCTVFYSGSVAAPG